MSQVLIKGGTVITVDPEFPDWFIGDVLYDEDGTIVAVAPELAAPDGVRVLPADGMIVMPGLVDSHRHPWQTLLRGLSTDQTVIEYRRTTRAELGQRHRPEDVFAATLLADLEAINSGVTMVADLAHIMNTPGHADAAVAAHHASGQRVLFAHGVPNDESAASWWSHSDRTHPDDIERLRHEVLSDDESLVTLGMFIRPPFLVTPRVLAHDITLARDLDIHMTMDGGVGGGCWGEGRWGDPGLRPVADIDRVGGLGPDLTLAHCNNLTAEEYDLIADSGTKISISPDHEMLCGHGLPATKNILEHGIEPGVSIDSVVAASGDMFAAMRSILTSTRGIWADRAYAGGTSIESWDITSRDVLRFATLRSAEANGMGTRTGSLTPGKRADIILLKSDPFNLTMLNNPVATVVTTAHPGNVDTVIIDGTIRKQDGKLIGQNIDAVITAAETSRRHVVGESGVDSAQRRSSEWAVFS